MLRTLMTTLLLCTFATAEASTLRSYGGGLENSRWRVTENSRLMCELNHQIPNYGAAVFSSQSGKIDNLSFELDMKRLPSDYSLAQVVSVAPSWRPGIGAKPITTMQWRKQFNGDVDQQSAWTMLTELEKGFFPTLYYADWHNKNDRVSVALSATNFRDNYYQFLDCVDNLLTYGFEDISYIVLHFKNNSSELDKESKEKLARIEEYLKHDKNIESIALKAYSSSWGGRYTNLKMSQKRAMQVKDYFVDFGIEPSQISTEGFGEKRHIASNQTELGRAENRRVVIEMVKP